MKELSEEIFCLQYELNALAEITLRKKSERWIPNFHHPSTEHDHIKRYEFASQYVKDKTILDIACGAGGGSYYLAEKGKAKRIVSCDIDPDAVRYAKYRNFHESTEFKVQDAEAYKNENYFDVIISFETIEHLKNYNQFFQNMSVSLKQNGLIIISTPISNQPLNFTPDNPYHTQEWGFQAFQNVLNEHFSLSEIYVQLYPAFRVPERVRLTPIYRLLKFLKKRLKESHNVDINNTISNDNLVSTLEKFTNQFQLAELGNERLGFQILVAKKR